MVEKPRPPDFDRVEDALYNSAFDLWSMDRREYPQEGSPSGCLLMDIPLGTRLSALSREEFRQFAAGIGRLARAVAPMKVTVRLEGARAGGLDGVLLAWPLDETEVGRTVRWADGESG